MVRNYKRKSNRQNWSTVDLNDAIQETKNMSIKNAVYKYNVPYSTLYDLCKNNEK